MPAQQVKSALWCATFADGRDIWIVAPDDRAALRAVQEVYGQEVDLMPVSRNPAGHVPPIVRACGDAEVLIAVEVQG